MLCFRIQDHISTQHHFCGLKWWQKQSPRISLIGNFWGYLSSQVVWLGDRCIVIRRAIENHSEIGSVFGTLEDLSSSLYNKSFYSGKGFPSPPLVTVHHYQPSEPTVGNYSLPAIWLILICLLVINNCFLKHVYIGRFHLVTSGSTFQGNS